MERSQVDLVDVLAFVRVAETGSFGRAAERMGLSKPVLSRRVARLESQLGARLLTRTARGAKPTDIGQTYYARAAGVLAELESAQEVVARRSPRSPDRSASPGRSRSESATLLPPWRNSPCFTRRWSSTSGSTTVSST